MDLSYFKRRRGLLRDILALPAFLQNAFDLFLASVGINMLGLALPIVLMQVYDRIVPTQATNTLLWLVIGFACALVLESVLRLCRSTITNWMAVKFEHGVAHACVERWLGGMIQVFDQDGAGVHLDRLRAASSLRNFYAGQAYQLLLDLPFSMIFLAVIWFLGGPHVAAFAAGMGVLFLLCIAIIRKRYSVNRLRQKQQADRRYNFLVEALSGIHTVKSITLEETMLRRHERLEEDAAQNDFDVIFIGNLPVGLGNMFSQVILFGILFVGGSLAIKGHMTMGSLAACTLLGGRFFQPLRSLAAFWVRHADIVIAKEQLRHIADLPEEFEPEAPNLPREIRGDIELDHVSFRYSDESPMVLDDLSLKIEARRMICLNTQGARGASTLLNVMYGLLPPLSGKVLVDGIDLSGVRHDDFKGRMEYIPQQGTLFNGTVFDNLTLFNPALQEQAMDAAALLELDEILSQLPLGYETRVGNRLYEFLPTGVIQRICLARSLTVRPRILLLNKVNDAMDTESERIFFWLLGKLKGRCTVVMATGSPQALSMADSVYALVDGGLVAMEADQC